MPRRSYPITEGVVRDAIAHTKDNTAAADYLNIALPTWKKYATRYIDEETGLTLYKLHSANYKKQTNFKAYWWNNMPEELKAKWGFKPKPIEDILSNKVEYKDNRRLMKRLVKEGVKKLECDICNYNYRTLYTGERDQTSAYYWTNWKLYRLDQNETNNALENLLLVCRCCEHNIFRNKKAYKDLITREDGSIKSGPEILESLMLLLGVAVNISNTEFFEVKEKFKPLVESPTTEQAIENIDGKTKNFFTDPEDDIELDWDS